MQSSKLVSRRYTKRVPFLSKMVYRRVRGWTTHVKLCWVFFLPLGMEHPWVKYCGGGIWYVVFL